MSYILFDGNNINDVASFIDKCDKEEYHDVYALIGEGELFCNGDYFKAPCYLFYSDDRFVCIPDNIVKELCK